MTRLELIMRVRSLTRDLSNSIFREIDIVNYINESIDRIKQLIPELRDMNYLLGRDEVPILLPGRYHHLLSIYSASRCFGQDERYYQSTSFMNEFETKFDELRMSIESGGVIIVDASGNEVIVLETTSYVKDIYFTTINADLDDGVGGV